MAAIFTVDETWIQYVTLETQTKFQQEGFGYGFRDQKAALLFEL